MPPYRFVVTLGPDLERVLQTVEQNGGSRSKYVRYALIKTAIEDGYIDPTCRAQLMRAIEHGGRRVTSRLEQMRKTRKQRERR
jgi:hypothetical protein